MLLKIFQKIKEEATLLNSHYKANVTRIPKPGKDTHTHTHTHTQPFRTISLMTADAITLTKTPAN